MYSERAITPFKSLKFYLGLNIIYVSHWISNFADVIFSLWKSHIGSC